MLAKEFTENATTSPYQPSLLQWKRELGKGNVEGRHDCQDLMALLYTPGKEGRGVRRCKMLLLGRRSFYELAKHGS